MKPSIRSRRREGPANAGASSVRRTRRRPSKRSLTNVTPRRWLRGLAGPSGLVAVAIVFAAGALVLILSQSGSAGGSDGGDPAAISSAARAGLLLGDAGKEGKRASARAGLALAFRFKATVSGSASDAHVFISSGNTAQLLRVGLYADVAGRPGRRLDAGAATHLRQGRWITVALSSAAIKRGRFYWLAVLARGGSLHYRVGYGTRCESRRSARTDLKTLPASWSGHGLGGGCPISAYATAATPAYLISVAPTVIAPPTISGIAAVGKALTASPGAWTGAPTTYGYGWQDCDVHGANCVAIAGATAATYAVALGDAGHTLRVVVTAANVHGAASAGSGATGTVPTPTNCINNLAACGFPDSASGNVGPGVPCSSLTPSGGMTVSTAGTTVQNMNITGQVTITASNVTLSHDCVTNNGGAASGSAALIVEAGGVGAQIDYSDIAGADNTSGSVEEAIRTNSESAHTTADHDYMFNCGECFHGAGTLTNDYVSADAMINEGQSDVDHYEGIYYGGGAGPLVVEHDTIIDPHDQTAAIFVSHDFGNVTTLTIADNILEGGDYVIYGGGSGSEGSLVGPVTVTGNRFATKNYAKGAQYGVSDEFNESVTHWSGNIWDNTLAAVPLGG